MKNIINMYNENPPKCQNFYFVCSTRNLKLKAEGKENIVNVFKLIKIHKCKANMFVVLKQEIFEILSSLVLNAFRPWIVVFFLFYLLQTQNILQTFGFFLWKKLNKEKTSMPFMYYLLSQSKLEQHWANWSETWENETAETLSVERKTNKPTQQNDSEESTIETKKKNDNKI